MNISNNNRILDCEIIESIGEKIKNNVNDVNGKKLVDISIVLDILNDHGINKPKDPLRRLLLPLFIVNDDDDDNSNNGKVDCLPFFDMVEKNNKELRYLIQQQHQQQQQYPVQSIQSVNSLQHPSQIQPIQQQKFSQPQKNNNIIITPPLTALSIASSSSPKVRFNAEEEIEEKQSSTSPPPPPPPKIQLEKRIPATQTSEPKYQQPKLSQKQLVILKRPQLQIAFQKFDQGQISLSKLREEVTDLGLSETMAFNSLCRHRPMQFAFHEFITSLGDDPSNINSPSQKIKPNNLTQNHQANNNTNETQKESLSTLSISLPQKSRLQQSEELRKKIYGSIRDLDLGVLSSSKFEQIVRDELGKELPQEVGRLIAYHKASGKVKFRDFARAFEPSIEELNRSPTKLNTTNDQIKVSSNDSNALSPTKLEFHENNDISDQQISNKSNIAKNDMTDPFYAIKMKPPAGGIIRQAQTDHGDILSWKGANYIDEDLLNNGKRLSGRANLTSLPFGTEFNMKPQNQNGFSSVGGVLSKETDSRENNKNQSQRYTPRPPPFATEY